MALSPQEVLANALNPTAAALNDYLTNRNAQAQRLQLAAIKGADERQKLNQEYALRAQNELALQTARDQAEGRRQDRRLAAQKDLNNADNQAAMERTREQIEGYVRKLDEQQLGQRASKLQEHGIQQLPGESLRDFVLRGTTAVVHATAGALDHFDTQLNDVEGRLDAALQEEKKRQATLAAVFTRKQFTDELPTLVDKKSLAGISAGLAAGLSPERAVAEALKKKALDANVAAQLQSKWQDALAANQSAAATKPSAEYLAAFNKLQNEHQSIAGRRNKLFETGWGAQAEFFRNTRKQEATPPALQGPPAPPPGGTPPPAHHGNTALTFPDPNTVSRPVSKFALTFSQPAVTAQAITDLMRQNVADQLSMPEDPAWKPAWALSADPRLLRRQRAAVADKIAERKQKIQSLSYGLPQGYLDLNQLEQLLTAEATVPKATNVPPPAEVLSLP